jgi:hypothetical protein
MALGRDLRKVPVIQAANSIGRSTGSTIRNPLSPRRSTAAFTTLPEKERRQIRQRSR